MLRDLEMMVCDPDKILVDRKPGSRAFGGYVEALVSRTKASFTTERKASEQQQLAAQGPSPQAWLIAAKLRFSACAKYGMDSFHRRVAVDQVCDGTFKADATRSGYFVSPEGLREEYDYDEDNLADVAEEESACNQVVEPCLCTANYETLGEVPRFLFPTCKRCF